MMKRRPILFLTVGLFILVGCSSGPEEPGGAPIQEPKPAPTQEIFQNPDGVIPQPTGQESNDFSDAPVEKFVSLATNDLAQTLGIDVEQIEVVETQAVIWPNSALGCPAPGEVYPQGKIPGYRITMIAGGQEYVYHTDLNGRVILCPYPDQNEGLPTGPTTGPDIGVPIP